MISMVLPEEGERDHHSVLFDILYAPATKYFVLHLSQKIFDHHTKKYTCTICTPVKDRKKIAANKKGFPNSKRIFLFCGLKGEYIYMYKQEQ